MHLPTLEGPLVMISLHDAEMGTAQALLQCRSKTWHGRCSIFRSNGCKDQFWHWEYAIGGACHGLFSHACFYYFDREQNGHC